MYRFIILVKYLTNFFKLKWNLGIEFTLRFFFLSVYSLRFPFFCVLFVSEGNHLDFYFTSAQLVLSAVLRTYNVSLYFIIVQIVFLFPLESLSTFWLLSKSNTA